MGDIKFKRHIPSGAVIFNDAKEVLMAKRFGEDENWHGRWNFPGGGIEFGEDPKETAIRETREEVGLEIEILSDFPMVMNYKDIKNNEDYICITYIAKHTGGDIDVTKDDGTSDAKWFRYEEINFDDCLPFTKEMLDIAIKFVNNL